MFLLCHIFPANPSTMIPKRKHIQGQWLPPAQPRQRQHSHSSSGWHFLPFPDRYVLFPGTSAVHQHTLTLTHPIPVPGKAQHPHGACGILGKRHDFPVPG